MEWNRRTSGLLGWAAVAGFIAATGAANAGGFAIREQSTYGQGSSFAGIAAGGALSSMFWNPATITQFNGKAVELGAAAILPHVSHSYTTATDATYGNAPGNSGIDTVVPSGYASWQLNDRFWLGFAVNAPFGLGVHFPQNWAGGRYASGEAAKLESYNFSPTAAVKLADWVSVAVGLQAQYLKVSYDALLTQTPLVAGINGAGWSAGWTAGITLTPTSSTTIGIGYRSALNQKINGNLDAPTGFPATTRGSVNLVLDLPDVVTVGLRQVMTDRFTLLAGLEWSNWSRIGTARLYQANGASATVGGSAVSFPFEYGDGWFYSLGGEYVIDPIWTVRGGIGFETSPVTDTVRTARLPDNDRIWYSAGASYKPPSVNGVVFDVGYSFIDVKDAPVCLGPAAAGGCPSNPWSSTTGVYVGTVNSYINIVSLALRYRWDDVPIKP
ncbi:MAG: transporter [Rhodopseudomonas sp.]|nr:transporter [Rhodopseudomonas sp.]